MNQEILSYLEGAEHDFGQGFALFCKYSRSEPLMNWISRRRDMDKLLYELGKLSKLDPVVSPFEDAHVARYAPVSTPAPAVETAPAPVPEPPAQFRTYDDRRTKRSDLPPELQAVYDTVADDFKLKRGLHEKMKMATTDSDRAKYRSMIIETDARIRLGYNQIDTYLAKKAEEKMKGDAFNESTCRSYISKALAREKNSPIQVNTVRARIRALQEHGCVIEEKTMEALRQKGLLQ